MERKVEITFEDICIASEEHPLSSELYSRARVRQLKEALKLANNPLYQRAINEIKSAINSGQPSEAARLAKMLNEFLCSDNGLKIDSAIESIAGTSVRNRL